MADLHDMLQEYVGNGSFPGAVGLVACGDRAEVAAAGSIAVGGPSMAGDGTAAAGGRRLLMADSVRMMTADHTTAAQREIGQLFLERQGWGFGGSVDVAAIDPWNVPGRYGWVGGTGASAHITSSAWHCRHPAHPSGRGQPDPAQLDTRLLAVCGQSLLMPAATRQSAALRNEAYAGAERSRLAGMALTAPSRRSRSACRPPCPSWRTQ